MAMTDQQKEIIKGNLQALAETVELTDQNIEDEFAGLEAGDYDEVLIAANWDQVSAGIQGLLEGVRQMLKKLG